MGKLKEDRRAAWEKGCTKRAALGEGGTGSREKVHGLGEKKREDPEEGQNRGFEELPGGGKG